MVKCSSLVLLAVSAMAAAQPYTRGVGAYPGDARQYDGPSLERDTAYRNLALHRPAYQSSAWDYNLTAQLVTDGIKQRELPMWVETSTSERNTLPKAEREAFLDDGIVSGVKVGGEHPWVQVDVRGAEPPLIDRMDVWLHKIWAPPPQGGWKIVVTGSDDGAAWNDVCQFQGIGFPGQKDSGPAFVTSIAFPKPVRFRSYRVTFSAPNVRTWEVADLQFFKNAKQVHMAGPEVFASAWMPAGKDDWVSVDLGAICTFDRIVMAWIRRAPGAIEVSYDGERWRELQKLATGSGVGDDIHLPRPEQARWVRVHVGLSLEGEHAVLSELEVWGRGGLMPVSQPATPPASSPMRLTRGKWKLQRASLVDATGEQIAHPGFVDRDWMIATVPGTVLTSYLNDGAIADPNFGENQYAISDSFFCADFWYRDEFAAPRTAGGGRFWLNFDGVNWKAEVFLNGRRLGRINGGFARSKFDVTGILKPGAVNALAVRIEQNAHPGGTKDKESDTPNGGDLGRDNPTYHASIGWDWMPTMRGRDTGIWGDVWLATTGPVTIEDPLVTTTLPLPDTSQAEVKIAATVRNSTKAAVNGVLRAQFGEVAVESRVVIGPDASQTVEFSPARFEALHINHPKLWWPNGYGDPNLYPVRLTFIANGKLSDTHAFQAGIRQFTYSEEGNALRIWINGRRLIARGGNWGFPESMLRYRQREYDIAMRFHRDQHFNMVRNWVGQTGDEAFYDAADRFGIVVWQDFWLANPWDGPDPDDEEFFLANARDYVLRIRNHASVGLFCGRNEGLPPKQLDSGLHALVEELEPGSHYISSSADGPVEGHGPYRVEPLRWYFEHTPPKLHSEIGAPNVPEFEILQRTLSKPGIWPIGPEWRLHDFYPDNPFETTARNYGGAEDLRQWGELAQFVDYDSYRGMFEGQSKNRPGVLIWMSHPAWPSLLWQTYDYFFDTDASYYAAKHACEPLHIQWNAANDAVEVVNYNAGDQKGLTARAEIIDLDGSVKWQEAAPIDSREDSTGSPFRLEFPQNLAGAHFIRLTLLNGDRVVSMNFYWHAKAGEDFSALRSLGTALVFDRTSIRRSGDKWRISTEIRNSSDQPALMVRAKVFGESSGEPILPVIFDDNYIALMPGETRTLDGELDNADTRGERPRVVVSGFNLVHPR